MIDPPSPMEGHMSHDEFLELVVQYLHRIESRIMMLEEIISDQQRLQKATIEYLKELKAKPKEALP